MSPPPKKPTGLTKAFLHGITGRRKRYAEACQTGRFDVVEQTLDKHPEAVHWTDEYGSTALHWAGSFRANDVVGYLLSKGADKDLPSRHGFTPLHYAAGNGADEIISQLASCGADLEARNDAGDTPLLHAVRCRQPLSLLMLSICGADFDAKGKDGQSTFEILCAQLGDGAATYVRTARARCLDNAAKELLEKELEALRKGLPTVVKITRPLKLKPQL